VLVYTAVSRFDMDLSPTSILFEPVFLEIGGANVLSFRSVTHILTDDDALSI